ncbi:MAG: hypothetical protein HZA35_00500 [Parcubacteria group bacterium]|nr:hypothetical protein [Parcubacteria group bacterium]
MKTLLHRIQGKSKLLSFLSIGVVALFLLFALFFFFRKTNSSEYKPFGIDVTSNNTKRTPVTLASSLTDDLGDRLSDKVVEKITSAQNPDDIKFSSPEEFTGFVQKYLNESADNYQQDLKQDIAKTVRVRTRMKSNATAQEKKAYLKATTALLNAKELPGFDANAESAQATQFYTELAKKLEALSVPTEYYPIHHELVRITKTRALAYNAIANTDADPVKSALMLKLLIQTEPQFALTTQVLTQKLALMH